MADAFLPIEPDAAAPETPSAFPQRVTFAQTKPGNQRTLVVEHFEAKNKRDLASWMLQKEWEATSPTSESQRRHPRAAALQRLLDADSEDLVDLEAALAQLPAGDMVAFANGRFEMNDARFAFAVDRDGRLEAFVKRLK